MRERPAGSGRWELRVAIGVDPATGKKRQVSRTVTGDRTSAVEALAVLEASTPRLSPSRRSQAGHGTQWHYRQGCRCRPCRSAWASENRKWYRRRLRRERARQLERARRRYPFGPVEQLADHWTAGELALRLGVHRSQLYRWRRYGVTVDQADTLACRVGRHPAELWPELAI
jgi:hypothetical protein